ncbi:juvenile hormone acid O-methyltransferase-like [Monomorium pharaonis]|uniref:juvenile hormone acid O-methyltransferase-like n=1 Tax=Monomorium pharaonis TaxID=307658 RepID=UPI0017463F51|nr:juvenile hormone acid O-methyltransferase-like [Monomorium pharaonis]
MSGNMANYNSNPVEYASSDEWQACNVQDVINDFVEDLRNISGKCMDVGCGPGNITRNVILPNLHPNAVIIGTDISATMIEYAKKAYSDNKRLEFEILDIETKSLPEKYISKLDHIFSFHTLQWCNDIRKAFENMYRMLKPGGTILVQFIANNTALETIKKLTQDVRFAPYVKKRYTFPFSNSIRPQEELKQLLKDIGFSVEHCSLCEVDSSNMNLDMYLSSIMSIFPFLDAMPRDKKKEFKVEYPREYKKINKIKYGVKQCSGKEESMLNLHTLLIVYAKKY